MLLHLVDGTLEDVAGAYRAVRRELESYGGGLTEKPELVALNKIDALTSEEAADKARTLADAVGGEVSRISGATGAGLPEVLRRLYRHVETARAGSRAAARPAMAEAWRP